MCRFVRFVGVFFFAFFWRCIGQFIFIPNLVYQKYDKYPVWWKYFLTTVFPVSIVLLEKKWFLVVTTIDPQEVISQTKYPYAYIASENVRKKNPSKSQKRMDNQPGNLALRHLIHSGIVGQFSSDFKKIDVMNLAILGDKKIGEKIANEVEHYFDQIYLFDPVAQLSLSAGKKRLAPYAHRSKVTACSMVVVFPEEEDAFLDFVPLLQPGAIVIFLQSPSGAVLEKLQNVPKFRAVHVYYEYEKILKSFPLRKEEDLKMNEIGMDGALLEGIVTLYTTSAKKAYYSQFQVLARQAGFQVKWKTVLCNTD